jgi:hypothetical protein
MFGDQCSSGDEGAQHQRGPTSNTEQFHPRTALLSSLDVGAVLLILIPGAMSYAANNKNPPDGTGGKGGSGSIEGGGGTIVGGRGGEGGISGRGGDGGSGSIKGRSGVIVGGDGGNAGTADGRGGRPTRSPGEVG